MIDIEIMVLRSEDGKKFGRLGSISLPAVPRVGDMVFTEGEKFEVRQVVWSDDSVELYVKSQAYGYSFLGRFQE